MQVAITAKSIKLQLSKAQVLKLRRKMGCMDRPIKYGAAELYWQGQSWYKIFVSLEDYDWATERQMAKALLRKIRSILCEAVHYEVVPAPFVDLPSDYFDGKSKQYVKPAALQLVSSNEKPITLTVGGVAPSRLENLAKIVNSKFHRP